MSPDQTKAASERVDRFLEKLFLDDKPAMRNILERSDAAGLAPIAVSPMQGLFLNILAASVGARRILEIGALGGYSTVWLARALPEEGRVVTLDIDPKSIATVRASAEAAGVGARVEAIEGPAAASLEKLIAGKTAPFDFVFIDADKDGYPLYLDLCLKLVRPGALIVADNVVRGGAVAEPQRGDPQAIGVRKYLEKARAHPRLSTSVIQTVGAKGHDGFAISRVF